MVNPPPSTFEPDYAIHPGRTLAETLKVSGMTMTEAAGRSGLARKTISGIINGREPITPDTAILFEKVFRVPARFWMNLQNNYEEALARLREQERLSRYQNWIKKEGIPIKHLISHGHIPSIKDPAAQLAATLMFFGVASPEEHSSLWRRIESVYTYRRSTQHQARFGPVSVWLRLGELAAGKARCDTFSREEFDTVLKRLRDLASKSVVESQELLIRELAGCGVALVFEPGIPGAPIHGATRWLTKDKALVQMSIRGKDDGNFWFTLFHELGHIWLHGKRDIFLEFERSEASCKEKEADAFARDILIPRVSYQRFIQKHGGERIPKRLKISKVSIKSFSSAIGVTPGIVVGRLQRDGWLPYSFCNDLKQRLCFTEKAR